MRRFPIPLSRSLVGLTLAVGLLLSGCSGSDNPSDNGSAPGSGGGPTATEKPGGSASSGASDLGGSAPDRPVTKLLVFVVENHSFEQMREEMPTTYALARRYGYSSDYTAETHPSLPNYLVIASGDTHGVTDDAPPAEHEVHGSTVFGRALDAGLTAGVFAEAMPTPCATSSGDGYAARHNPWVYYVDERDQCEQFDLPMDAFGPAVAAGELPDAGFVVPDLCHDAHDCPLQEADAWLRTQLQTVFSGPDWASGQLAVVITADEDDDSHVPDTDNRVMTVVVHPSQHGNVVEGPLTHHALYGLYEDVLGLPHDAGPQGPSMADAFGLPLAR